jgi:two-component system, OmpR family, response regulator
VATGKIESDVTAERQAEARLLVVEDDPNIVELLSASLPYAGFDIATARDGRQALRLGRAAFDQIAPD